LISALLSINTASALTKKYIFPPFTSHLMMHYLLWQALVEQSFLVLCCDIWTVVYKITFSQLLLPQLF